MLVTGDFNVRLCSWWKNDLAKSEVNPVDTTLRPSSYGLS